ncbi:hypothetical protein CTI12_AA525350 [Artemisia annua]|uniref:RNA-directed DNA polymerase, eukaryota, Reverse transcriptase zinc-binding domain protein n=1 Tax=Artemisia annua TaxID=35608 RepID=A0A2U1L6C4_ARTAN|nr:hypothetical protein CTI12_AA525350 [Artemisia annua]
MTCQICYRKGHNSLGSIEDVQHVFFKCDVAVEVWKKVASWLDLQIPAIDDISMLLDWAEASISDAKKRKVVGAIIYTTIWMLWRFRNSIVFKDPKMKKSHIYDNIVIHSFDWCMNRCGLDKRCFAIDLITNRLEPFETSLDDH